MFWKFDKQQASKFSATDIDANTAQNSKEGYRNIVPYSGKTAVINVKDEFYWNINDVAGPNSARDKAPSIRIIEKKILHNALYAQLAYSAGVFVESSQTAIPLLANKGKELADAAQTKEKSNNTMSALSDALKGVAKGTDNAKALNAAIDASAKSAGIDLSAKSIGASGAGLGALEPYSGLYLTEKTGFEYIFPYYNNTFLQGNLNAGDSGNNGALLPGIANIIKKKVSTGFVEMGYNSIIETAADILPNSIGGAINVDFYLFNTIDYQHVVKNWQLVYLLAYQARMGRLNKSLIDLPTIYEIQISGSEYIPYAYLENVKIEFVGNRRAIDIINAYELDDNKITVNTIVPEAYKVTLQFKSLIRDSKNIMYAGLNKASKINTSINGIMTTTDYQNYASNTKSRIGKPV